MASSSSIEEEIAKQAILKYKKDQEQKEKIQERIKAFMDKVIITLRYPETREQVIKSNIVEAFKRLSTEEKERLIHIAEVHDANEIKRIVLCPSKGDKTGNQLAGFLVALDNKTILKDISIIVNPHAPFMLTAAVPVSSDQELLGKPIKELRVMFKQTLLNAVKDLPSEGPSIQDIYSNDSEADAAQWPTFFPSKNASIGLYRDKGSLLLIGTSHAGEQAFSDLQKIAIESGAMDAETFVHNEKVAKIKHMARRNLMRLLHMVASTLKFQYNHEIDQHAHIPRFHRPTRMAVPMFLNCNGNYRQTAHNETVFFQDCIDNGASLGGIALIRGAHHDGYTMVKQSPSFVTASSMLLPMSTSKVPLTHLKCLPEHESDLASSVGVSRITGEDHVITHRTHEVISASSFHEHSLKPIGLYSSGDWSENRALPITVVFH
jgi:hypothetical protein